jgi:putative lipoic acid-binding regulatory protein
MNQVNDPKLEIHYPCLWQYRLIGEDRGSIIEVIRASVDIAVCTITEGNVSSGGRYLTLNLQISVNNDAERLRLYQIFSNHPAIRIVL